MTQGTIVVGVPYHLIFYRTSSMLSVETPLTSHSTTDEMASMFYNAQNTHIIGSSFNITTFNTVNRPPLDALYEHVAPNAILNAGGRADIVRCYAGTREEVIGRIEKWGDGQCGQTAPMLWLTGPAGAGKSAIVQAIAERYKQQGLPQANFFFFRADTSRSNASPLIPTLLHQIVLLYPYVRAPVAAALSTNPLIFDSTLEDQLTHLIVPPLCLIHQSSSVYRPLLVLIDGVDECDSKSKRSQQQILHAFDHVLIEHPHLFRLLVASRDESQIRSAFKKISSLCLCINLDQYLPENDIRLYVNAQFEEIKKAHPLSHTVHATWPPVADIHYIVAKSSGQFIYAATVMRFISESSASPILSLERVKGAAELSTKSPFSHLDTLYTYILSQVDDQEALKVVLHAQLFIERAVEVTFQLLERKPRKLPLVELTELYHKKYNRTAVVSCLADLTSLGRYTSTSRELLLYHASFSEYLLDQSRSGDYFVDVAAFSYKVMPIVWECICNEPDDVHWIWFGLVGISQLQKLPPGLLNILVSSHHIWSYVNLDGCCIFALIYNLCVTDDDVVNLKCLVRQFINLIYPHRNFFSFTELAKIPFSCRYVQMARADNYYTLDSEMAAALQPTTKSDRDELAVWLNGFLHRLHKSVYPCDVKHYMQLLREWISWAVRNDIPCEALHNLPGARWCIWRNITKKWAVRNLKIGSSRK